MINKSTLQEVDITKVFNSKTNPRKTFDEGSMKELQESIAKVGILQPILLRKHPSLKDSDKFELVCGERRYRAAALAGLKTIPANIRELTDDEAFEMQIIENLERKDVHPLEEAEAFKRMLDSGKYQIADIAAKFAKPETFIAQRLKFVDLIEEIKKDFYEGKLGIGHAIHIARLGEKDQQDIYKESSSGWNPGYGTVQELKDHLEDETYNLDNAPFSTTRDESMKGGKLACSVCPKRSGANPTLFPDIEDSNRCFDTACYDQKMEAHISRTIARIIENGEDVLFGRGYNTPEGFIKDVIQEYKLKVLKKYDDFREGEAFTQKLFYISGSDAGKTVTVKLRESESKSDSKSNVQDSVESQIMKIKERAKRAIELDNVKVFQAIKEDPILFDEYPLSDEPLTDLETKAMWYLFDKQVLDYFASDKYKDLVGKPNSYNDLKAFEFFRDTPIEKLKTSQLARMAIKSQLTTMHEPNYDKCTNSRFYMEIIQEKHPDLVKTKVDAQNEIADKRIARTNKKLEELSGGSEREDSLETRLEKLIDFGLVIDDNKKEIGNGGFSMTLESIKGQSTEEFKAMFDSLTSLKSKPKK